jgi:putative ABC transport system permease protein
MSDLVDASEGERRLITRLLGAFAGAAALIAVLGIYGVVSYSVLRRTKEIGIRRALGASSGKIVGSVVAHGFFLALTGALLGTSTAFAVTRVLESLLFRVSTTDSETFLSVSVLFIAVGVLASYIPARRAARVDPMVALRYE